MIVVLLIADSLKGDTLGYAGGSATTPFADQLASGGTVFEHAFASAAWTIPSIASMITGRLGHHIGIGRWRHPFPARQPTLLTAFAAAGYQVTCFHPYPRWGFHNFPGSGTIANSQEPDAVVKALSGPKGRDRFVLIHHWWTHLPYLNTKLKLPAWHKACDFSIESLGKFPRRIAPTLEGSYLKAASYLSEELLGRYLDAAGAAGEDVLFVLTSDHGETWGRSWPAGHRAANVYDLHGRWITDETIRVPLLFWGKRVQKAVPAGQRLGGFARGVDLGPTIAELAGVPWPGPAPESDGPFFVDQGLPADPTEIPVQGRSLAKHIAEGTPAPSKEVMTVSSHNTHVPRTYPDDGREMWRTMALRTQSNWFVFDGVAATRDASPVNGTEQPGATETETVFSKLEKEWRSAVDSGPLIPEELFPQPDRAQSADAAAVEDRLRTLGYLD